MANQKVKMKKKKRGKEKKIKSDTPKFLNRELVKKPCKASKKVKNKVNSGGQEAPVVINEPVREVVTYEKVTTEVVDNIRTPIYNPSPTKTSTLTEIPKTPRNRAYPESDKELISLIYGKKPKKKGKRIRVNATQLENRLASINQALLEQRLPKDVVAIQVSNRYDVTLRHAYRMIKKAEQRRRDLIAGSHTQLLSNAIAEYDMIIVLALNGKKEKKTVERNKKLKNGKVKRITKEVEFYLIHPNPMLALKAMRERNEMLGLIGTKGGVALNIMNMNMNQEDVGASNYANMKQIVAGIPTDVLEKIRQPMTYEQFSDDKDGGVFEGTTWDIKKKGKLLKTSQVS